MVVGAIASFGILAPELILGKIPSGNPIQAADEATQSNCDSLQYGCLANTILPNNEVHLIVKL